MDVLTFTTAGSVDDGKSTMIGRLLHDSGSFTDDQLESVSRSSRRLGSTDIDLALLTDGLRAEREQGITIDVAYRYFTTAARKFVVADTPGHVEYTRNMVVGASVSDLAVVLVDARDGLTEQTRRHLYLLRLIRVPHLTLAINKMDLVGYSRERFVELVEAVREYLAGLEEPADGPALAAIPISALVGDNVVTTSEAMPWYDGPTLLAHLEQVELDAERVDTPARLPVQYVLRPRTGPEKDYRGYAGEIAGGALRTGDEVVVLPGGTRTTVSAIEGLHGELTDATAPMSVVVRLSDELDLARGDMICGVTDPAEVRRELDAVVCWMDEDELAPGRRLLLKHASNTVRARVEDIGSRLDVSTRTATPTERLGLNDIARVRLSTAEPVLVDEYARNRRTGSFILIDPQSNRTVAAGIVESTEGSR